MNGGLKKFTLPRLALGLLFCAFAVSLHGASLTATLDRTTIREGEAARLTLTFHDGQPESFPNLPPPPGLTIGYQNQSSSTQIINGRMNSSVSLNYTVAASREGTYTIPAVTAKVGNQTVSSQPLTLTVVSRATQMPEDDIIRQLAFLRMVVPKREFYVGEVFSFQVQLHLASGRDVMLPEIEAPGFLIGKAGKESQDRVRSGNQIYSRITIPFSATALKSGPLKFGPAKMKLTVFVPNRRRDPFDFFGSSSGDPRSVTLQSDAFDVNVLPLPEAGKPADFTGIVGSYDMTATIAPTDIAVGDPITVRIQIAGQGPLDTIKAPSTENWRDFKSYGANSSVQPSDDLGISGIKTFEQVIIPENADVKEVPAFSFSFFDPQKKTYRTLTQAATPLKVRASSGPQAQPAVLSGPAASTRMSDATREIVHIKPHLGMVAPLRAPLITQPWFVALNILPILAWVSLAVWRKRQDALANDPRKQRKIAVEQLVAAGLIELRTHAAANASDEFFATVFRLVQEQLGERLDLPATAITESVIEEQLQPRGVSTEITDALEEIFQACNQARYAPVRSTAELNSVAARVESLLAQLRDLKVEAIK